MRRVIQYISLMLLAMMVTISCDSVTSNNVGSNDQATLSSSSIGSANSSHVDGDAEITSPNEGEVFYNYGIINFSATAESAGDNDPQWAVRFGTCESGTGALFGNTGGSDEKPEYDWVEPNFSVDIDMSENLEGDYCFVFNPREASGEDDVRLELNFTLGPSPEVKNECKKGGWQDYGFKNQGQCVRYVNTGKDSR